MTNSLIEYIEKDAKPNDPFYTEDDIPHVDGSAFVPIEVRLNLLKQSSPVGTSLVFLIDNSGSMRGNDGSDEDGLRFSAIKELAETFRVHRNTLDEISIVVFSGEPAGSETIVWKDWSTWSEIDSWISNIDNHRPPTGTYTPMAKGMDLANAQFSSVTNSYKMVIMLTDGVPASSSNPSYDTVQEDQISNSHVPFAKDHGIIYSVIPLGLDNNESMNNLKFICVETNYVFPLDPEFFYLDNANDADMIEDCYEEAFCAIKDRLVSRNLSIREIVNPLLSIRNAEISIQLTSESGNMVHPATPSEQALERFEDDNIFEITFMELVGEVILSFEVGLNQTLVELNDVSGDFIEIEVNNTIDSNCSYQHGNLGIVTTEPGNWPQTVIRFLTGVRVTKELLYDTDTEEYHVNIKVLNLSYSPLNWFWVRESPSLEVDSSERQDDYQFDPFSLIVDELLVKHSIDLFPHDVRRRLPQFSFASYFDLIKDAYRTQLNPFLCRYWFSGTPITQHGYFIATKDIPALGDKNFKIKIQGSKFTPNGNSISTKSVDHPLKKPSENSIYRHALIDNYEDLVPNPDFSQITTQGPKADLSIRTCFDGYIYEFYESLLGITRIPNDDLFDMLDSEDITPMGVWFQPDEQRFGLRIKIRNSGNVAGQGRLVIRSIFIPFLEKGTSPSSWNESIFECGAVRDINIAAGGQGMIPNITELEVPYEEIIDYKGNRLTQPAIPPKEFHGWMINTVEIKNIGGEIMSGNNRAIEITAILPPHDDFTLRSATIDWISVRRELSRYHFSSL